MPGTKKGKAQGGNFEQENVLQAVVVADRFDERFQPLSDNVPLALFPLANKPLLAYTLDFLSSSGVQQIYVYCCHCSPQIKEYLANSKWGAKSSQCQITPIVSSDFTSLGDVLRDIDQKSLFETDFLLVSGDLVSNMSLQQALNEHRERRTKDKNKPLMTLLLHSCSPTHETRSAEDDMIVALDSRTQQVLHYQKIGLTKKTKFEFPLKTLLQTECSNIEFRYDFSDVGVAICSSQVPQLFTDNFDYQTKEDFIKGILINEEFLGNQIHIHTIKRDFAARISTLHMYDTISKAVMSRWIYPYVPDNSFETSENQFSKKKESNSPPLSSKLYRHLRRNVYIGDIKSLGKDTSIEDNCVIGHDTVIGNNCKIRNSIIGFGCVIGDGVNIEGCYLWSDVTVKNNCTIVKSILSNNSVVHENTILSSGCILTSKVEIGPNIKLKEDTVVHIEYEEETFAEGEDIQKKETNPSLVGDKGRGMLWSKIDDEDSDAEEDEDVGIDIVREGIWGMSLSKRDEIYPIYSDDQSSDGDDEISTDGSDIQDYEDEDNSLTLFFKEVKDSLARGIEESVKCDNLILEINSSKYAYNVTIEDVICNVTKSAFEISYSQCNGSPYFPALKKVLLYLSPVFMNYNKTSQTQMECVNEIERYCIHNKHAYDCLIKILMFLYENDILAEEVILLWHKKPSTIENIGDADVSPEKLRSSVTKFIDWLKEAEEESSDDDSS